MDELYLRKLVSRYLDKKSTDEELEVFVILMKQGILDQYIEEAMAAEAVFLQESEPAITIKRPFRWKLWTVAASVMLVAGVLLLRPATKPSAPELAKIHRIKIYNPHHLIQKVILPDSSTVWLSPESQLSYPSKFGNYRQVQLQGEAFFEVTKDHQHPFVISSGKVLTKVWGTSFRVRSYQNEDRTRVSVLTGKVSVTTPAHQEIFLYPAQEAVYKPKTSRLSKEKIAVSELGVWKKADLTFDNIPLRKIAEVLSSYYAVHLQVEGESLQQSLLTADFSGRNLADILLLISKSLHTTYSIENKQIIISTTTTKPESIN